MASGFSANGVDRHLRGEVSVEQLRFNLKLDNEHIKLPTYYLYRSEEYEGNRPIIDGVYIQRGTLGPNPPKDITILLE